MRTLRALIPVLVLAVCASAATYRLKAGDNLSRVARSFGVSVPALAQANGISNPNYVVAGRTLTIPGGAQAAKRAGAPASVALGVHRIRSGETLASIARKHGMSVAELKAANGLSSSRIYAGRTLKVKGGAASALLCPVKGHHTIVSNYGAPRPGRRSHLGNDIFAARGTPVIAPVGGRLSAASGAVAGLALYLEGDDGNTYYFAHLHSMARSRGTVAAGSMLGSVGNTGNARALPPHLHVSISPGGAGPINPIAILRAAC